MYIFHKCIWVLVHSAQVHPTSSSVVHNTALRTVLVVCTRLGQFSIDVHALRCQSRSVVTYHPTNPWRFPYMSLLNAALVLYCWKSMRPTSNSPSINPLFQWIRRLISWEFRQWTRVFSLRVMHFESIASFGSIVVLSSPTMVTQCQVFHFLFRVLVMSNLALVPCKETTLGNFLMILFTNSMVIYILQKSPT